MSDQDIYGATGSPRSAFFGAARASNPRTHSLHSPYARPRSRIEAPGSAGGANGDSTALALANGSPVVRRSPSKQVALARSGRGGLPTSSSSGSLGSLRRSGSEASLLSGLKSLFSRPFSWLASPSKDMSGVQHARSRGLLAREEGSTGGTKRDSLSSFGANAEDPDSPTDRREGKRLRRKSPVRDRGAYDPEEGGDDGFSSDEGEAGLNGRHLLVTGRAITGTMLPALPASLTLNGAAVRRSKTTTNFSRPLPSSQSMPYLDPPSTLFASPQRSTRAGSRLATGGATLPAHGFGRSGSSRQLNITEFGAQEDEEMQDEAQGGRVLRSATVGKGKGRISLRGDEPAPLEAKSAWSPWKDRYRNSMTPAGRREYAPEAKDYALPSLSPFKAAHPASPLRQMTPSRGLTRSATARDLRRGSTILSDYDMDNQARSPQLGRHSTLLVSEAPRDDARTHRSSVDPERERENSVLDWFMRDRWSKEMSPASAAAAKRIGSVAPQPSLPPIRRGQMVWAGGDKGFVREGELKAAEQPKPQHRNDAERILFALESMRKTPLTEARSASSLPSELIGSSSRQLRKAINVPLATAQAGDSARRRRDQDRLGDDFNVMVSPYGRRKQSRRAGSAMDEDYQPSRSRSASMDDRTETASQASEMSSRQSEQPSERSPTPPPAPTPRRSTRLKRGERAHEDGEATPRARKSTKGKAAQSAKKTGETATPKTTRRTRKASSEPRRSPSPPAPSAAAPSVPTITETAPSPNQPSRTAGSSSYQPRPDGPSSGGSSRGGSSLRARTESTKRTHTGAASYQSSRATTPNSGNGRFSANEDDLPPLEELEQLDQPKLSLGGLSGLKFEGFGQSSGSAPAQTSNEPSGLSNRLAPASSQASASNSAGGLSVPSGPRPGAGPLSRLNATRPRASSPLASAPSIIAAPDSPPTTKKPSSEAPAPAEPPVATSNGFGFFPIGASAPASGSATPSAPANLFAGIGGNDAGSSAKKSAGGLGIGKPSKAPAAASSGQESARDLAPSGIPDFFGKSSAANSGTTTPTAPLPTLDFGLKRKPDEESAAPVKGPATFSFGAKDAAPAAPATGPAAFTFGGEKKDAPAPAASGGFSFGAMPTEPAAIKTAQPFSFGTPKAPEAAATSSTAAKSFSFGGEKPAETPKPATASETTKPAFSFGSSAAGPSAPSTSSAPTEAAKTSTSSFGTPAASEKPASQPGFSFGAPASAPPAAPASAPEPPKSGGFSFNTPTASGPSAASGKPAEAPKPFAFGSSTPAPAASSTPAAPFTFGSGSGAKPAGSSSSASNGFAFGSAATGTTSAAPAAKPFAFGAAPAAPASTAAAPASAPFTFGAPAQAAAPSNPFASSAAPTTSTEAPKSNPFASTSSTSTSFGASSGGFGQASNTTQSTPGAFTFGAPSAPATPAANTAPTSFNFGAQASTPTTPGFGTNAAPQTGGFGAAQPAAASNGFGFSFGSTTPAAAPPASGSGFGGFGAQQQQQQQQQQPTTPGGSTFAFGAPANSGNTGFSFGAAPAGSTTPAGNPPANNPFAFGGASAGSPAPAGPAVRFGSPSPALDAGGFSLGAAAQPPGSPSGRPIKALRRGTKR